MEKFGLFDRQKIHRWVWEWSCNVLDSDDESWSTCWAVWNFCFLAQISYHKSVFVPAVLYVCREVWPQLCLSVELRDVEWAEQPRLWQHHCVNPRYSLIYIYCCLSENTVISAYKFWSKWTRNKMFLDS